MFIRKPNELSDGQRYRFCLAKLIESKAKVWVADEFLAVLDRTTAKVISLQPSENRSKSRGHRFSGDYSRRYGGRPSAECHDRQKIP